jgi:hypothetical protein
MPSWNDPSVILALLAFAIGGSLIAVALLVLEYFRQRQAATPTTVAIGITLSLIALVGGLAGLRCPSTWPARFWAA